MRKRISWLLICCLLLINFNGCATTPKEIVRYETVPANAIIVFDGKTSWKYNLDEWMVVKRETYKAVWDSFNEKDAELKNCLERERLK